MPQDPRYMDYAKEALHGDFARFLHTHNHLMEALILADLPPSIELAIAMVVMGLAVIQHSGTSLDTADLALLQLLAAKLSDEVLPKQFKDMVLASHFNDPQH